MKKTCLAVLFLLLTTLPAGNVLAEKNLPGVMLLLLNRGIQVPEGAVLSAGNQIWMDRNLGASRVATSLTDSEAYGYLYQWGRLSDGHEKPSSGTTAALSAGDVPGHGDFIVMNKSPFDWRSSANDSLWQGVSGTNNPCPSGFRLPTREEWEIERASWISNDAAGAYASPLKLVAGGYRYEWDGKLLPANNTSYGYYWSSTVEGPQASYLFFHNLDAGTSAQSRAKGYSVRCIMD